MGGEEIPEKMDDDVGGGPVVGGIGQGESRSNSAKTVKS